MNSPETSLTAKRTLPELVDVYVKACADIEHAFSIVNSAELRLTDAFGDPTRFRSVSVHQGRDYIRWDEPKDSLKEVKRQVWRCIVDRSEVRRFLSISEAEKLDHQLEKGEMPEITLQSVSDFVNSMTSQLPALADAAIVEVFDWLRPRAGYAADRYKTNKKEVVGERVCISSVVKFEGKFTTTPYQVNYYQEKRLTALENVFRAIDGQGQRTKSHYSELSNAIKASTDGKGETAYFEFKAYKNGSLHIRFKRADLLKKFNARAGGKNLKGATS